MFHVSIVAVPRILVLSRYLFITAVSHLIPMFTKSQHRPIISLEYMPEYICNNQ